MSLLNPEQMADAVQAAESLVSDESSPAGSETVTEDAVEAKPDGAETEPDAEDQPEQNSGEEADVSAGSKEESADDGDGISGLSDEDEAWLEKYLSDSGSSDDEPEGDVSGLDQLRSRIAQLERDRAVSLAERKLQSEINAASARHPGVSVDDMIAAVQANPYLKVEEWAAREASRVRSVEARIEARIRKELKIEKAERADELSPPRGRRAKSSESSSAKKYKSVAEATSALRKDMMSGRFS